jgi:A/G-specific adenine glycosylase
LSRLSGDPAPIDAAPGADRVRARAEALVQVAPEAGAMNEALMELGALVCTPKAVRCEACPWRAVCVARRDGTVMELPKKSPKRARARMDVACVVVRDGARVWLERRSDRGLFGGMYEPPSRVIDGDDVKQAWRALLAERGIPAPKRFSKPIVVERTLTHRDLRFHVARVAYAGPGAWVESFDGVGISSAVRAVLRSAE